MEKKELMYEGKAKEIFATDNEDVILMHIKPHYFRYYL